MNKTIAGMSLKDRMHIIEMYTDEEKMTPRIKSLRAKYPKLFRHQRARAIVSAKLPEISEELKKQLDADVRRKMAKRY